MKNKTFRFTLTIIILGFVSILSAQTITQTEFLDQLKQTHPIFEKERLTAQIEEVMKKQKKPTIKITGTQVFQLFQFQEKCETMIFFQCLFYK